MLTLLLVLGSFLRFYHLDEQSYWMDEGYTINAVLSIQEHGSTVLDSGNEYSCLTYCYITAYIAKSFGNNAFSFRLLSVLAGIFFIATIFYITKRFFGNTIGLVTSVFVTFSYWQIAWSRQVRWYTLFALFFWLAIFFFYKFTQTEDKKEKIKLFMGIALFTLLSYLTHGLGYLLPFIFVAWYFIEEIFIKKKNSWKRPLIWVSISLALISTFDMTLGSHLLQKLFENINFNYNLPYHLSFILRNYWLFILFALYAVYAPDKENRHLRYFLIFIFLAYLTFLSFLTNIVHYRYLFHVSPVLIILGTLGMHDVYLLINKKWQRAGFIILIALLFFTFGGGVLKHKEMYLLEADNPETIGARPHYSYTPQPDWNKAYAFIKENKTEEEIVISSLPHFNKIFLGIPGYWIKYNYMGLTDRESKTVNNKEFYVNAETLNNLEEVKSLTRDFHGYIIFDFMAINGKIDGEIIDYIESKFDLVFYHKINTYSRVWVYKF